MKNKFMKLITITACLLLVLLVFSGCGNDQQGSNEQKSTLVMGTNAEFPPFEYISDNGIVENFDGIDVAIAKEIADGLGMELKIENMEFDSIIPSLKTGKVDVGIAGMTIKPDRQENVDFTDTYYKATQVMIVREDSEIASASDLADKKVGVVLGYTGDTIVSEMNANISIERYKKGIDAVVELKNGKLDAVVIDSAPADAFVAKNEGLKIVTDSNAFEGEEYAMAVEKGNTELLDKLNAELKKLKESGKIDEISQQYIDNMNNE